MLKCHAFWSRFAGDQGGTVAVLFALTLILTVSSIAVGVDYGRAVKVKSRMQAALDAAVIAGATQTNSALQASVAAGVFKADFNGQDSGAVTPTFSPTLSGALSGTATANVPTLFAGIMGIKQIPVTVNAVVNSAPQSSSNSGAVACVLVLAATDAQAFLANSGADVNAPDCEVHVKSTASPAAIFNVGTVLDTSRICISGANIIDNGGTHPNMQTSCATVNDPFAGILPVPATSGCNFSNQNYSGNVTLTPGVYCGWFNFNSGTNVTFAPGVYVIEGGGWNVNGGTWTGSGVTFYFADQSKIQFNSGVAATLTAPTSGTYKGIVMYEAEGLARSPLVFDDSMGFNLSGLMHLPSRDVTFNSGSGLTNRTMTLVVNTLILDGVTWNLSSASRDIPIATTATSAGVPVLSQ